MASHGPRARSLYRSLLRELPARQPSLLANPSPIQHHIRADFATPHQSESHASLPASLQHQLQKPIEQRLKEAEQYLIYLRAQREYITLLERYNPGMNMTEEERVRLTARRVGMEIPVEVAKGEQEEGG